MGELRCRTNNSAQHLVYPDYYKIVDPVTDSVYTCQSNLTVNHISLTGNISVEDKCYVVKLCSESD